MKEETLEHRERRHQKEAKELIARRRELARPKPRYYLWTLLLIVSLAFITDEVASIVTVQVQSNIINDLFVPLTSGGTYNDGLSLYQSLSYIIYPLMFLAFFYKPLADRFGRKPFLVINTIGMSLGMIIVYLCHDVYLYFVGYGLMMFFISHDMHSVYIMEVSKPKWRATTYGVTKFLAVLGTMLIPLSKTLYMDKLSLSWHYVLLIPSIFGFIVAFLVLLFARETDPFLKQRIAYLESSDEERLAKQQNDKESTSQGGLFSALKFCFKHKQLRYILIASGFFYLSSVVTSTYSSIMSESAHMSDSDVTFALWFYSLANAIMQLIGGLISDKKGRKKAVVVMSSLAVVSYILFVFSAMKGWNAAFTGLMIGTFIGSYWSAGDTMGNIMLAEASPTNLRSSAATVQSLIFGLFSVVGTVVFIVVQLYIKETALGYAYMIWLVPWMVISLAIMGSKVKETKGTDVEKVTGNEGDNEVKFPID
jgi:MFS family permease